MREKSKVSNLQIVKKYKNIFLILMELGKKKLWH